MDKPVIGITSSILFEKDYRFPGYPRIYINKDYVDSIISSGGTPLIIPVGANESLIQKYISQIDGLLLSGGMDIDPTKYEENPSLNLGKINPDKDFLDFTVLDYALKKDIPILGICRGMQIINIYFGGTLYQDISNNKDYTLQHYQKGPKSDTLGHYVNVDKGTKLHNTVKNDRFQINSYHLQFIKYHSKNMKITARSEDDAVEAIETEDNKFIIGVQWHPERIYHQSPESKALFDKLIEKSLN